MKCFRTASNAAIFQQIHLNCSRVYCTKLKNINRDCSNRTAWGWELSAHFTDWVEGIVISIVIISWDTQIAEQEYMNLTDLGISPKILQNLITSNLYHRRTTFWKYRTGILSMTITIKKLPRRYRINISWAIENWSHT